MVIDQEGNHERSFDIYSRLLKDRIIMITGEIEDYMSSIVCAQILYLASESKKKDINIYVNSPGGVVTAGLAIVSTMKTCGCDIKTVAMGQVCSMGSFIASAGTKGKRLSLDGTRWMIHQVSSGASRASETDLRIQLDETTRLKKYLTQKLSDWTGKPYEEVFQDCERDKFMSSQEALEYGLCDKIIEW